MKIEYLDTASSNLAFRKWVPATLECNPSSLKVYSLDNTERYSQQMANLDSIEIVTLTGGEPAYFRISTIGGDHSVSIRPKPRKFRAIKQISDLMNIATVINTNANRALVDSTRLKKLQLLSWLPVLWLVIVLTVMLIVIAV